MNNFKAYQIILIVLITSASISCSEKNSSKISLGSPSGSIELVFTLAGKAQPSYEVFFHDKKIIHPSLLGFEFKDQPEFAGNFSIMNIKKNSFKNSWELPWGEQKKVTDHYNELTISLKEDNDPGRQIKIIFKAYDDGVAFRYTFPDQENMAEAEILEENTEFNFSLDHECWWIPGDWDSYEHLYNNTRLSEIDALSKFDPGLNQCYIVENSVHTPFTLRTGEDIYISIHEADLTDYASMTLIADTSELKFTAGLVDSERYGYAVKRTLPFNTPWRTIQIADKPGDLIESKMILNLNEPRKIKDISWFEPMKYNGIWWEMHLGMSGWDMEGEMHGATTENAKKYIDFAAENNIGGTLVEGWNTGWDRWTGIPDREGVFDFVTPYEDYDFEEVVNYAKEKGVQLIMHHETSAAPRTYEEQLDSAYSLMQKHGLHAAKLGYVGKIIPDGEHHHGQWMVNHYRKVVETAAKYQVAVNIHEPIKQTGLRRTFPNLVSAEGLRGQEFNAWAADGGNPPDHLTIIPFTRMLAGPIDYTPGIFNIKLDPYRPNNQVNTTLAHQLALYVIIYSPVQMVADLPEYYKDHSAMEFIRNVGIDWEQSKVLDARIGDYVSLARQKRNSEEWYAGMITDENPREMQLDLSFLDENKKYTATIYRDSTKAHWDRNPVDYRVEKTKVTKTSKLTINLAAGGGAAISIIPLTSSDSEKGDS